MNISYNAAHAREYCITNNIYVPKPITFTIEHTQYVQGESGFQVGQELENVGWHYAKILQIDSDLHFMGHYYVSVGDIFDISEEPYINAVLGKSNLSSEGQNVHGIAKIYLYN